MSGTSSPRAGTGRPLEAAAWWAAGVVAAALHNGWWATPNLETFAAAAGAFPGRALGTAGPGDYVLSSASTIAAGRLVGWTAPHEYARLHLVVALVGSAAIVVLAHRRGGVALARAIAVVLAMSPLATVSAQWLGQPDPVTGGCALAAVLVRRWWAVALLAVVAGGAHPEQAIVAFAAVVAIRWAWPERDVPDGPERSGLAGNAAGAAAALGGVVVGAALGRAWLWWSGTSITRGRLAYLELGASTFAEHHLQEPLALVWFLLGPLWLLVAALVVGAVRGEPLDDRARRLALTATAVGLLALVPTAVTLDETRVFAVITAPALAALAWFLAAWPPRAARRLGAGLLVVTALVPGGFTTGTATVRSDLDHAAMGRFLVDGSLPPGSPPIGLWLLAPLDVDLPSLPGGD